MSRHTDKNKTSKQADKNSTKTSADKTKISKNALGNKTKAHVDKNKMSIQADKIAAYAGKNKIVRLKHTSKKKALVKPVFYSKHENLFWFQQAPKKLSLFLLHSFAIYSKQMAIHFYSNMHRLKTQNVTKEEDNVASGLSVAGLSAVKKLLLNRVCAINNVLVPSYNRRTHSISHTNSVINQNRKVSKTFGYIARKTLRFWIGLALAACYGSPVTNFANTRLKPKISNSKDPKDPKDGGYSKGTIECSLLNDSCLNLYQKPTVLLMNTIETRAAVLLWRTQMCKSLFHAKQVINHQGFQWIKQNSPLESFRLSLKYSHSHSYVKKSVKLENRASAKNSLIQDQYYPVTRYSNWVYCGSTLRLLPLQK